MSNYKCTLIVGEADTGAADTIITGDVTDTAAAAAIQAWVDARCACYYNVVSILGLRVSIRGQARSSKLIRPNGGTLPNSSATVTLRSPGVRAITNPMGPPGLLQVSLDYYIKYNNGYSKLRYLCGIPQALAPYQPIAYDPSMAPGWCKYADAYFGLLANGAYYLEAQTPVANGGDGVIGLVSQAAAPTNVGVVINGAAPVGTYVQGGKIALTHMRAAKGTRASTMNGTWYVDSVNTTLQPGNLVIFLRNSSTIDPATQRFTDKTRIRPVAKSLYQIQAVEPYMVRTHKRGKPSTSPRGRRLTYTSLDP